MLKFDEENKEITETNKWSVADIHYLYEDHKDFYKNAPEKLTDKQCWDILKEYAGYCQNSDSSMDMDGLSNAIMNYMDENYELIGDGEEYRTEDGELEF